MHHGQNEDALSAFKKTSPLKETVSGKKQGELSPLKSGSRTTRGLVKKHRSRGTGQPARSLQRIKGSNLSGYSGRSARPGGAALVLPRCDTRGMQGHPEDRSSQVEPGAHALIIPDQAGGHTTTNLDSPDNITLLPLPPRSPAPVENLWIQKMDPWVLNFQKWYELTGGAAQSTSNAVERISALNEASEKIKQIVEIIAEIAEQINFLALNATIEAAQAGDAGEGFAVVASEVKSSANQTQRATEDISKQVTDMLFEIEASTDSMQVMKSAVNKTNETVTSIASAVEEQSATVGNLSRSAQAARDKIMSVVEDINVVAADANSTSTATEELQQSSNELDTRINPLT